MWKNYFFTVDFTPAAEFLLTLTEDTLLTPEQETTLVALFREHDPRGGKRERWHANDHDDSYNLRAARVLYVGPNAPQYRTNARFSHVVVIELRDPEVKPEDSIIYLQFNAG